MVSPSSSSQEVMAAPADSTPSPPSQEIGLKFVLVGDSGSGKTNLLRRFVKGEFQELNESTVGIEFATRTLNLKEGVAIKAQIWDTCGQERFSSLTSAFFRGTVGAMLVYDIANRQSFLNLESWLNLVRAHAHKNIAMSLVGNKLDLANVDGRQVSTAEGAWWAGAHGLDFVETSAKDATYVETAFRRLIMSVAQLLPVWNNNDDHNSRYDNKALGNSSSSSGGGTGKEGQEQEPPPPPLPKGWVKMNSHMREGGVSYENMWTGERVSSCPTAPALAYNTIPREALSFVAYGSPSSKEADKPGAIAIAMGHTAPPGVTMTCFNGHCIVM